MISANALTLSRAIRWDLICTVLCSLCDNNSDDDIKLCICLSCRLWCYWWLCLLYNRILCCHVTGNALSLSLCVVYYFACSFFQFKQWQRYLYIQVRCWTAPHLETTTLMLCSPSHFTVLSHHLKFHNLNCWFRVRLRLLKGLVFSA